MTKYIENFSSKEDILEQFSVDPDALNGATIYLAWYGYGSYDGQALVIFKKDKKLYEVNGSHCSCSGLEGQWSPEETTWEALAIRKIDDSYTSGSSEAQEELNKLVKKYL